MALLFIDGFDHTTNSFLSHMTKWSGASSGAIVPNVGYQRTGRGSLFISLGSSAYTRPLPASGGFVIGIAIKAMLYSDPPWGSGDIIRICEGPVTGGTIHLALGTDGADHFCIRRGTTVIATGTRLLVSNNWYHLQFKGIIDGTSGSYDVRIDGVPETGLSASGVNTRNGGATGQWDNVGIVSSTSNGHYFDDLYICDQSGSINNDFLGLCRIETLVPEYTYVSPGTYAEWGTGYGASPAAYDHGAVVNDLPADENGYIRSGVAGARETFRFPAPTGFGLVHGVQINLYSAVNDTGVIGSSRTLCSLVRTGGVDYTGPTVAPTVRTFQSTWNVRQVNPATGVKWTTAEITALEAGAKIVT
jgi:hypothetical protein